MYWVIFPIVGCLSDHPYFNYRHEVHQKQQDICVSTDDQYSLISSVIGHASVSLINPPPATISYWLLSWWHQIRTGQDRPFFIQGNEGNEGAPYLCELASGCPLSLIMPLPWLRPPLYSDQIQHQLWLYIIQFAWTHQLGHTWCLASMRLPKGLDQCMPINQHTCLHVSIWNIMGSVNSSHKDADHVYFRCCVHISTGLC